MGNMTFIGWLWFLGPIAAVAASLVWLWKNQSRRALRERDAVAAHAASLTEALAVRVQEIVDLQAALRANAQHAEAVSSSAPVLHDALTGLPGRILFDDRLQTALHQGRRYQRTVALLRVDLDHFGEVNAALGRAAGDQLLAEAAQRLCGCVRESDTVARLGDDDFAVLLFETIGVGEVEQVTRRIVDALREPYYLDAGTTRLTGSVGIGLYPLHGTDGTALQRCAEASLRDVRESGGNAWRLPEPDVGAKQHQGALL
jgi:diguanylate cyclase (GGDEF)-like protein